MSKSSESPNYTLHLELKDGRWVWQVFDSETDLRPILSGHAMFKRSSMADARDAMLRYQLEKGGNTKEEYTWFDNNWTRKGKFR